MFNHWPVIMTHGQLYGWPYPPRKSLASQGDEACPLPDKEFGTKGSLDNGAETHHTGSRLVGPFGITAKISQSGQGHRCGGATAVPGGGWPHTDTEQFHPP